MPEHESWCCRSPQSPCAQNGGCSGSCNCGVDESIDSMPNAWRMFAHRYDDGLFYNLGEKWWVEIHALPQPIVEVNVIEVASEDPVATHWGWIETSLRETDPVMIWPREGLFEMCFPYGSKVEAERGKGRVVRLTVTEVPDA